MDKAYVSIKEFAKIFNVHPNTVRNSIKSGKINAFQLTPGRNSKYFIPASEIDRIGILDLRKRIISFSGLTDTL